MDQPDKVYCYQCRELIGWQSPDTYIWTCPKCHKITQVQDGNRFVEATQEVLTLLKKIELINATYRKMQDPYVTKIYGGRAIGFKAFEPTDSARAVADFGAPFLLAIVGIAFLFTRYRSVGGLLIGLAVILGVLFRLKSSGSTRSYDRIEARRLEEISAIHDRIRKILSNA